MRENKKKKFTHLFLLRLTPDNLNKLVKISNKEKKSRNQVINNLINEAKI